jgi:pimeloyl-ACP methyl ester carboxylesterase
VGAFLYCVKSGCYANPPIGLTFHDDPNDDVLHARGEGGPQFPTFLLWGEKDTVGPGASLVRAEWLPNFVKSVSSLTPVVSAIMTIKASVQKRSTLKEKRVPQGTATLL